MILGNVFGSGKAAFAKSLDVTGWALTIEMYLDLARRPAFVTNPLFYIHIIPFLAAVFTILLL
jgi:hypothetical protein